MGTTASKSEQIRLKKERSKTRQYRLPSVRQKDRYDAVETTNFNTAYEASIDKFDYLIIFPLTEGPYIHPTKVDDRDGGARISWGEIRTMWQSAVPGTDVRKDNAVNELKKIWKLRTGSDPIDKDTMRMNAWLTIARETIVDQLSSKCGLQLKLTANSSYIFCRIRAPIKLLELQADKDNYPLQLRGEIDPGSEEFWNVEIKGVPVEIEEEKKLYDLESAKLVLEKLYRAGKISPNDIGINPDLENQATYSRRIHALERIADRVPISNKYVAYTSYLSTKPNLRYLYQTYPSIRGQTLFRSKDRLLLTKSIIDSNVDIDMLASRGVVTTFMALHDANRGERLTIDSLAKMWVAPWVPSALDVGAPTVTHEAYEDGVALWAILRPFAQPLAQVREYFGEKVAIYFAWLGFFTYYLTIPTVFGIAAEILYYIRGYKDTVGNLDFPMYVYAFLMVSWSVFFDQSWKTECKAIALKWGTRGFESEEKDRPQFRGDPAQPIERSAITNRNETNFPSSKRTFLTLFSYVVILLVVVADLALTYYIFWYQNYLIERDSSRYGTKDMYFAVSILIAVQIQFSSWGFKFLAKALNDYENHRTDTDYEDAKVVKILTFEMFNSFAACIFTAFVKESVFDSCYSTCINDLRTLLYAIIVVRLVKRGLDVAYTAYSGFSRKMQSEATAARKEESQALTSESNDDVQFIAEVYREPYEGTFNDFAEAYMQFGYINLFCVVMPILPIISLVENLVKMRLDAYSLCSLTRRPHVEQCEDAGYWTQNLTLMIYLGVYMTAALFVFAMTDMSQYSTDVKLIIFFASSVALIMYVYLIQSLMLEETDFIKDTAARQAFIVNKFVMGFEDDDENLNTNLMGNLDDAIDVDGLNLYDLRKGLQISDADYSLMESLERQRRDLLRELKMTKDRLQDVYKTEVFNENSGVGETKHGLPLGRVSVKLVEIKSLLLEELDLKPADMETYVNKHNSKPLPIKIRVSFVGTKAGAPAPAPAFGNLADTLKLSLDKSGTVVINQSLGPFAPIRTIDADVVFDVMFLSEKQDPVKVASASISLRDLHDQAQQNKILSMKIKQKDGTEKQSLARLYVNLTFQYSKVVPIRSRVYFIQDKLQTLERELSRLKAGKK